MDKTWKAQTKPTAYFSHREIGGFLGDQKGDEDESVLRELWRSFWRCLWPRAQPSWSYLTMCFSCQASCQLPNPPNLQPAPRRLLTQLRSSESPAFAALWALLSLSFIHLSLSRSLLDGFPREMEKIECLLSVYSTISTPPPPPLYLSLSLSLNPKADLSSWVVCIYSGGLCIQANPSSENRTKGRTRTHKPNRGRRVIPHAVMDSPSWFSMRRPTRVMNCTSGMTN